MPKYYYQIGEVANMLGVRTHTLRYWESEFPKLKPKKNRSGKRSYTLDDIEILKKIKYLLYDQNYNIEGARNKMKEDANIILPDPAKIDRSCHAFKEKIIQKLENIQDTIHLSPQVQDTVEKKKKVIKLINKINDLLTVKKVKQKTWFPASSDSDYLD